MSVGSTASTIRDEEVQELGLEAARSRRNQDRRDNRPSPRPTPPRPVDDSPRISIHQIFAYQRAERARNRQSNGEVVPAGQTALDEHAVVENADDIVRPELPLLLEDQVFEEEYADTDSPGHSDDEISDANPDSDAIHSSDDAPSLIQTIAESVIDEPSGLDAPDG